MSATQKRRRERQREYVRQIIQAPCSKCGKKEKHFIHASLGEPSFYLCEVENND